MSTLIPNPEKIPQPIQLSDEGIAFADFFVKWVETYPAKRNAKFNEWKMHGTFSQTFSKETIYEYFDFLKERSAGVYELLSIKRTDLCDEHGVPFLGDRMDKKMDLDLVVIKYH